MNKRLHLRCILADYLDVYLQHNNQLVGHLGDISSRGLLLFTNYPLKKDDILQVVIVLPEGQRRLALRLIVRYFDYSVSGVGTEIVSKLSVKTRCLLNDIQQNYSIAAL